MFGFPFAASIIAEETNGPIKADVFPIYFGVSIVMLKEWNQFCYVPQKRERRTRT